MVAKSNPIASVAALPRFYYPDVGLPMTIFSLFLEIFKHILENFPFRVFETFADMKSQREDIENVIFFQVKMLFHHVKKSLFVADISVMLKMIVNFQLLR